VVPLQLPDTTYRITSDSTDSTTFRNGSYLAAILLKPSVAGFQFAQGGEVPSAAGGWNVSGSPRGIPAILHPREMVLPARLADTVRRASEAQGGMIGGGGHSFAMNAFSRAFVVLASDWTATRLPSSDQLTDFTSWI